MPSSLTFKLKAIVDLHQAQTLEVRQGLVRPSAPELCEFIFETSKLILGEMFKTDKTQTSTLHCPQKFVEFKMCLLRVAVLRILNQKDHQRRHNRCCSVNCQLPSVRKMEPRSEQSPDYDYRDGYDERPRRSDRIGG